MQAWIPAHAVSSSLCFWKSVFSFPADSILKSDGDFISNWTPDCVHFFGAWARQLKERRKNCSPIGHNNTKHFLCPIRSRHPLEFSEIARWESVPRGFFARTWKLSSRLLSRRDWLPLGLRGWIQRCGRQQERQKNNLFNKPNNNFARASRFFVYFFPVFAWLRRENA